MFGGFLGFGGNFASLLIKKTWYIKTKNGTARPVFETAESENHPGFRSNLPMSIYTMSQRFNHLPRSG